MLICRALRCIHCELCNKVLIVCSNCGMEFDDEDLIYCDDDKHYCKCCGLKEKGIIDRSIEDNEYAELGV